MFCTKWSHIVHTKYTQTIYEKLARENMHVYFIRIMCVYLCVYISVLPRQGLLLTMCLLNVNVVLTFDVHTIYVSTFLVYIKYLFHVTVIFSHNMHNNRGEQVLLQNGIKLT